MSGGTSGDECPFGTAEPPAYQGTAPPRGEPTAQHAVDAKALDIGMTKTQSGLIKYRTEVEKCSYKNAKKHWAEACHAVAILEGATGGLSEPQQKILDEFRQAKESADATLDRLALLNEAQAHLIKCKDPLQKIKSQIDKAEDKQDGLGMKKQWAVLQERSEAIRNNPSYHQFAEVQSLLQDLETLEPKLQEQSAAAVINKEMRDAVTKCERIVKDLEKASSKGQGQQVLSLWTKLKIASECFITGPKATMYAQYGQVQEFLKKYNALAPHVEEDGRRMIHEQEANEMLEKVQRPMAHAFIFIDKGDKAEADKMRWEIYNVARTLIDDPFGYYSGFEQVQRFASEYKRLMEMQVKERGPDLSGPRDHVGKENWQENLEACTVCAKPFTFIRRRHHCRVCGCVACDKCCPKPKFSDKNRICVKCQ
uniref:FYVE-type domain-containing protein n=1 Tax=Eutreptiella gymnastica TaxID=73025 RepID=A0A7S1IKB7_9EUGL|mmetsp:Transcript_23817/g.42909  ORF Transcript_23817/g.42909 Transcript_23817/m.42909 type:complete len:424 (+) Transcript_23817:24-1295(+)